MKLLARLLLFLFVAFLAAPTVVIIIKKSCNVSVFFDFSEEEDDSQKEMKNFVLQELVSIEVTLRNFDEMNFIFSNKIEVHDNIISFIFAPPPNMG